MKLDKSEASLQLQMMIKCCENAPSKKKKKKVVKMSWKLEKGEIDTHEYRGSRPQSRSLFRV